MFCSHRFLVCNHYHWICFHSFTFASSKNFKGRLQSSTCNRTVFSSLIVKAEESIMMHDHVGKPCWCKTGCEIVHFILLYFPLKEFWSCFDMQTVEQRVCLHVFICKSGTHIYGCSYTVIVVNLQRVSDIWPVVFDYDKQGTSSCSVCLSYALIQSRLSLNYITNEKAYVEKKFLCTFQIGQCSIYFWGEVKASRSHLTFTISYWNLTHFMNTNSG